MQTDSTTQGHSSLMWLIIVIIVFAVAIFMAEKHQLVKSKSGTDPGKPDVGYAVGLAVGGGVLSWVLVSVISGLTPKKQ